MLREKYIYLETEHQNKCSLKNVLVRRLGYKPEELLTSFLKEQERCYCTSFSFPPKKANGKAKKTQQQNYDYFINTLAEMVEKYAPDILE